jgi:predicted phosphoribosyltransferase
MAVHEVSELRDRSHVFRDRTHAGEVLAGMLADCREGDACVLAVPAGGVPVAAALCRALGLPLGVAVVSKLTPPWNSEVGYGAMAFDGTLRLNEEMVAHLGLEPRELERGIAATRRKVERRTGALRGSVGPADVAGRPAILVDDGLASGFTMRVALEALRRHAPARVLVAVPTAPVRSVRFFEPLVDDLYCANVRGGFGFAVAEAYQRWVDVDESEAAAILAGFRKEES